jgi:hypothetical protein
LIHGGEEFRSASSVTFADAVVAKETNVALPATNWYERLNQTEYIHGSHISEGIHHYNLSASFMAFEHYRLSRPSQLITKAFITSPHGFYGNSFYHCA